MNTRVPLVRKSNRALFFIPLVALAVLCLLLLLVYSLGSLNRSEPRPSRQASAIRTNAVMTVVAQFTQTGEMQLASATRTENAHALETIAWIPTWTPRAMPNTTETMQALLFAPHEDGVYLVGVDIGAGAWRSTPGYSICYWETTTRNGDIVAKDLGPSGGTVSVVSQVFQVRLERCGTWIYVGPP
jgi:hypothetical protein